MFKNIIVAVLLVALVLVTHALVRVENQRYALSLGMCPSTDPAFPLPDLKCLATVETRTAWFRHVYYALTDSL